MGPQRRYQYHLSDNRRRGISDRRRVKIGTHLLKSTDQGLDVAGVLLDSRNLISNASISQCLRVGVDHVVVLVSYDELPRWQRSEMK
jgi:hypothetical protein